MNKKEAVDGPFLKKRCNLPFNFGRPVARTNSGCVQVQKIVKARLP